MHNQKLLAVAAVLIASATLELISSTYAQTSASVAATPRASVKSGSRARVSSRTEAVTQEALRLRAQRLPVRRVSLYKNGVGFFEHVGSVTGNQSVTIDFTTAQLNDVLQSLTAIDLNGGRIAGAGYNSTTPLDQQLKALPLALGADASAADFYQAIRGARLEVHSGNATFIGRLLNIEVQKTTHEDDTDKGKPAGPGLEKRYLTLVSDAGAVRTIELASNTEVRLLDTELHQDVKQYLELLAKASNQELRHLRLQANGSGVRELRVSYLSEVPVWKATYRILFGKALEVSKNAQGPVETATLQGWAVVDNTVGTDWENVELSLIAGAPQSFVQPISQPYYSRRPEIGLPQEAQLTPQTHDSGESMMANGPLQGGIAGMGAAAGGTAGGAIGGILGGVGNAQANGGPVASAPARDIRITRQDSVSPISYEDSAAKSLAPDTRTNAFDDYFEYRLSSPVTIRKNESALVPILQAKVDAERVTLWSPSQAQALRALWLTNTSDLTLDRGSFSIVEDGRFGGEGLLDPIHPRERRLLSYAADQAVRVSTDSQHDTHKLQQVAVSKGILTERTVQVTEQEYLVHNAAPESRNVIIEQPVRIGWELDSQVEPVERTATVYRFRVATAAGETVRLHIAERHTISQSYQLSSMGIDQLEYLIRTNGEDTRLRQQLAPIFEARRKLAELDTQLAATQKSIDDIANDQKRLRDNLAALKGSAEERALTRRYTDELNQQEDRLAALRKDQEVIRKGRAAAEEELGDKIEALQLDEKLA